MRDTDKMALLGGKRLHLILTDSRGSGVEDKMKEIGTMKELVEFRICKGATLFELADEAEKHLKYCPFDIVYIAGGACDVTCKNKRTFLPALQHTVHRYCKGVRKNYYHHQKTGFICRSY